MKTLYLDIFSGLSGDMFLGAMIDLGVDLHALEHELEKLGLEGYELHTSRQQRSHIAGTKFDVDLHEPHGKPGHVHAGEPAHRHEHEHTHQHHGHSHGHEHHDHEHGGHSHEPGHDHDHDCDGHD